MKLTKSKLYQLIREELEIHLAPENLDELDPEEAYGLGYQAKEDHEEGEHLFEAVRNYYRIKQKQKE